MPTLFDPAWTAFGRAEPIPHTREQLDALSRSLAMSVPDIEAMIADELKGATIWKNTIYQVIEKRVGPMVHLSIKRIDRQSIHDWRDLQRIKNELVGPGHEAVELYPAESRVVDTANQYHLWVAADRRYRFPFGFQSGGRIDAYEDGSGARQRPFAR